MINKPKRLIFYIDICSVKQEKLLIIKTYDKVFYSEANKQGSGLHRG